MLSRRAKKLRSWMFLYAGLVAAVATADGHVGPAVEKRHTLSPVELRTAAPALVVEKLTDRADI